VRSSDEHAAAEMQRHPSLGKDAALRSAAKSFARAVQSTFADLCTLVSAQSSSSSSSSAAAAGDGGSGGGPARAVLLLDKNHPHAASWAGANK
jgi:hypothetical protein